MQNLISLNSLQGEAFGLLGKADGYKVLKCPTCEEIFAVRIDVENMRCPHCSHQSIKTQNCDYSSAIFKHDEKYRKLMDAKKISLIAFLILLVLAVVCVDSGAMSFITGLLSSIALISYSHYSLLISLEEKLLNIEWNNWLRNLEGQQKNI